MLLDGKVCLISGCDHGIGYEMVRIFSENGAIVYANVLNNNIDDYCSDLAQKNNTEVIPLYFDIRDKTASREAFTRIKLEHGGVDVLVNNAAKSSNALLEMVTRKELDDLFEVNVYAQIDMIQQAVRQIKKKKGGCIINFSSCVGIHGNPGQLVYSATKGAMNAVTKTLAKELAKYNIRVNAVAPGLTKTPMYDNVDEKEMKDRVSRITLGRLAKPEEIANFCVFLASDKASYITGQIIKIDGCMLM